MFNKNDPLVNSVRNVMEQNELQRRVEELVNEHFGITSKKALPTELHSQYNALFEATLNEAKKLDPVGQEDDDIDNDNIPNTKYDKYLKHRRDVRGAAIKGRLKEDTLNEESVDHGDMASYHENMADKHGQVGGNSDHNEAAKAHEKAATQHELAQKSLNKNGPNSSEYEAAAKTALIATRNAKEATRNAGGALARQLKEQSEAQKEKVKKVMGEYKRGKLHSGSKEGPIVKKRKQGIAIALNQAGLSKKSKSKESNVMNEDIQSLLEEIRSNLEEELAYVYENYDEATFVEYVNSLTEEQLGILGLFEQGAITQQSQGAPRRDARANLGGQPMSSGSPAPAAQPRVSGSGPVGSRIVGSGDTPLMRGGNTPAPVRKDPRANLGGQPMPSGSPAPAAQPIVKTGSGPLDSRTAFGSNTPLKAGGNAPAAAPAAPAAKRPAAPAARPRPGAAAKPGMRQQQRPGASSRPARPASRGNETTGDIMNRSYGIREETESPNTIKESFEQFLRNKFIKG